MRSWSRRPAVIDHDLLTEILRKLCAHRASEHIGDPAGREPTTRRMVLFG